MPGERNPVKVVEGALALGFTLSEAMQRALGRTLSAFGQEFGHSPSEVSMCVRRYEGRIYPDIRESFARALRVDRAKVDEWIDAQVAETEPNGAAA